MKVLVWKSHGDIEVYCIDTNEQLSRVVQMMIDCVDGWGLEAEILKAKADLEVFPGCRPNLLRAYRIIRNAVTEGERHEAFEDIFITDVVEK